MLRRLLPAAVALALAFATAPARAHPPTPAAAPAPTPRTDGRCTALPQESFFVPTRGGDIFVRLTRPRCPDGLRQTVPVLLTYTPYALLSSEPDGALSGLVRHGYARAVADVAGTGNSGGCWDYGGARERDSAYDLVQFLGSQLWSNGKVAMIGSSYDGTTANMAAVAAPPHLATIVPVVAISDWYSYSYADGVRYAALDPVQRQSVIVNEQGLDTPAAFDLGFGLVPSRNRDDQELARHNAERLCPGATDKAEHIARGYSAAPDYDAFWRERGYVHNAHRVRVPVFVQSGWRDYNVKHTESTRWFEALPLDPSGEDGVPFKMLVMGQQGHAEPDIAEVDVLLRAWLDRFLYGFDGSHPSRPDTFITAQPPVLSRANDGAIRTEGSWPPEASEAVALHLRARGFGLTDDGTRASVTLTSSATASESRALATLGAGQGDPDVAWWVSRPLTADLRIAGAPEVRLRAATMGTSTHFTPVLFDLGPPGTSPETSCSFAPEADACVVARGFLNARYAGGLDQGRDLVPGAPYDATIRMTGNDWIVKAGNRIAVALMATNGWWAVPDAQRAPSTVGENLSRLILPIVGGVAAAHAAGLSPA